MDAVRWNGKINHSLC